MHVLGAPPPYMTPVGAWLTLPQRHGALHPRTGDSRRGSHPRMCSTGHREAGRVPRGPDGLAVPPTCTGLDARAVHPYGACAPRPRAAGAEFPTAPATADVLIGADGLRSRTRIDHRPAAAGGTRAAQRRRLRPRLDLAAPVSWTSASAGGASWATYERRLVVHQPPSPEPGGWLAAVGRGSAPAGLFADDDLPCASRPGRAVRRLADLRLPRVSTWHRRQVLVGDAVAASPPPARGLDGVRGRGDAALPAGPPSTSERSRPNGSAPPRRGRRPRGNGPDAKAPAGRPVGGTGGLRRLAGRGTGHHIDWDSRSRLTPRRGRTVAGCTPVARPSIVPIALTLDDRTGYTLWAPPWEEDGEEWQAFLGTTEDDRRPAARRGPPLPRPRRRSRRTAGPAPTTTSPTTRCGRSWSGSAPPT